MGDVINVSFGQPQPDARARLKARRERLGLAAPTATAPREDLAMDHLDNGMPSDVAYCAPASDPA